MVGEEASFFALVDGTHALPLAAAQDHKRAFDGEQGPNTGGMGAYSPAPVMTPDMIKRTMDEIIWPTVHGMAARGTPFKGVLFAGLMITADGPKLIEYNVRFGDPEAQVLMMRLKSDLLPALIATADGVLKTFDLRWHDDAGADGGDGLEGLPRQLRQGHADRRARRCTRGAGGRAVPCRHGPRRRPAARSRRARAQRHGARQDRRRGTARRLRGGRQDRLAGRLLPQATSAGAPSSESARHDCGRSLLHNGSSPLGGEDARPWLTGALASRESGPRSMARL